VVRDLRASPAEEHFAADVGRRWHEMQSPTTAFLARFKESIQAQVRFRALVLALRGCAAAVAG